MENNLKPDPAKSTDASASKLASSSAESTTSTSASTVEKQLSPGLAMIQRLCDQDPHFSLVVWPRDLTKAKSQAHNPASLSGDKSAARSGLP